MKKSTVLILLIIFLGSVLIVGIFGMQSVPYESIVYVESIVPTSVITSDGQQVAIQKNTRGEYYAIIDYKPSYKDGVEVFEVSVGYNLEPADCTNKNVKVVILGDAENLPCDPLPEDSSDWRGEIVFHRAQAIHVQYRAQDSATGAVMDLYIYFV